MTPSYFKTYAAADFDLQRPVDVAVIMPTIIRPTMKQALQSVFRQAPARRIQILIGIDRPDGDVALIEAICAERPPIAASMSLIPAIRRRCAMAACTRPMTAACCVAF